MLLVVSLGMNLLVLLEILWAFEGLAADFADVGLEGCVHYVQGQGADKRANGRRRTSEMARNVIALGAGGVAVLPLAGQTEIVGGLAADMVIAQVIVEVLWVCEGLCA